MKRFFFMLAAAAILFAGTVGADDDYRHEDSGAEFYGVVDALPPAGLDGVWQVNGRQIVVDRRTEIKEKRGRVEVGAYVKVEGYPSGTSFMAAEIEVKGRRR